MTREYELFVVVRPTLTQDDANALWERIKSSIIQRGGELGQEEIWGTRRLAMPIKKAGQKFLEGNYRLVRFRSNPEGVRELENTLRLTEEVLRFLVVSTKPIPVAAGQATAPAAAEAPASPVQPEQAEQKKEG